ncbi:MAG: hypothetical protein LDL39_09385 [Magnetospirillum sp.]|nr:hypothetical protein [Magnetospirillum sp.]
MPSNGVVGPVVDAAMGRDVVIAQLVEGALGVHEVVGIDAVIGADGGFQREHGIGPVMDWKGIMASTNTKTGVVMRTNKKHLAWRREKERTEAMPHVIMRSSCSGMERRHGRPGDPVRR